MEGTTSDGGVTAAYIPQQDCNRQERELAEERAKRRRLEEQIHKEALCSSLGEELC